MIDNRNEEANEAPKHVVKHYWLYILKLEQNKYYVGLSTNPSRRIQEHKNRFYTAQFVKKYNYIDNLPFIDLGYITFDEAQILENLKTLEIMKQYGYQNVRGGEFNYSGRYVKIGSRFIPGEPFVIIAGTLFLLFVIIFLFFDTKR